MSIIKLNNKAVSNATAFGSISSLGSMTFIKKLTASSSATLSFVDGSDGVVLDNTYKEYVFTFNNIHTSGNDIKFLMQGNASGGSGYNETITSTYFRAYHNEAGTSSALSYEAGQDLAQSTNFHELIDSLGSDNDQAMCGSMKLFNPSSTTFVKHFMSKCNNAHQGNFTLNVFTAGYFNTTSAIDEIEYKYNSGNIDSGDICLYGIA